MVTYLEMVSEHKFRSMAASVPKKMQETDSKKDFLYWAHGSLKAV